MIMIDTTYLVEYSVELGYGLIYLLLAIFTYQKQKTTQNKLAKYFFFAFLFLACGGLYGGVAGLLSKTVYIGIPVIGNKIKEIYEGLTVIALGFFLLGLMKIRSD